MLDPTAPSPARLDFDADVLAASRERPVLVDFWAPWCGPCRALGPTLDRLAAEADGRWSLVKVNTDEAPDLSARYGIRGIPAVKLFVEGEVAAEFTGALPEPAVRQWLAEHLPSAGRARLEAGREAFAVGNLEAARTDLEAALTDPEAERAPWAAEARTLLARALVFRDADRARPLVDGLHTTEAGAVRTLADALGRDPEALPDGPVRDRSAEALAALQAGRLDEAVEAYIDTIVRDRYYDDDGARKAVVALFQTLGEAHPVVKKHRPAFNMSLY